MEFKEALKEILKIKGISALEDQSTLKLLGGYGAFDEYPVFRSIMESIIANKAGEVLQNIFYYSVEDKGEAWKDTKQKLVERLPYDEVFMNLFFDDLEYAFMGYAYEKGAFDRDINSDVEEMLGQVWTDDRGVKYSADKKRLINASEITGTYIVNPETEYIDSYCVPRYTRLLAPALSIRRRRSLIIEQFWEIAPIRSSSRLMALAVENGERIKLATSKRLIITLLCMSIIVARDYSSGSTMARWQSDI